MTTVESDQPRAMLDVLLKESGIEIGDDMLDRVAGLYRHFVANRAKLAAADLGGLEPVTIFPVDVAQAGRDDDRK